MDKHGEISFTWENDVFIIKAVGSFNEQGIKYYAPILKEALLNRTVDKWKRLEVWDEEALGCPKTLALAKEVYEWYEANGCTLTAVVISNMVQSHIIKDVFQSNAELFINQEEAIEWLNTHHKFKK